MTFLFFGDSFTAGEELLDHKFYPEYPTPVSLLDLDSEYIKKWKKEYKPLWQLKTKNELENIVKEQKKHSYAHKLAELCNIEYENFAISGSSIQKIRYLLTTEVQKNNNSNLTVFVQPTGAERWMEYIDDQWMDFIVGNEYHDDIKEYFKFKILSNNDYSRFCVWLLEMQAMYDFCSNNDKIKDFYFVNNGTFNSIASIQYQDLLTTYSTLISNINQRLFHFPHTKNNEEKVFLPFGHVTEKVHEQLAIDIHNILCYNKK